MSNMSQHSSYKNYADHAFGDGAFNWMPAPAIVLKRPNLQPNRTFHVSALAPENRPNEITRAMSKSTAGSTDTSAAPKAKGDGNKGAGMGILATFIASLASPNRPQITHGTGFGRHKVLDAEAT